MQRKTRKNIFAALAITLCAGIFTACGGSNTVAFNAFWHKNATAPTPGIETLTYSVSFEAGTGLGFGYSVKDATGTYTTVLTTDVTEGKMTYQYTTQLNVAITYEFKGEQKTFDDYVESTVVFERATDALRPISSEKKMVSHSPANSEATTWDECYNKYEIEVSSNYQTKKCTVKTIVNDQTDKVSTSENTIKSEDGYTQIDNEQLFLALRGLNATSSTLLVYAPFSDAAQKVGVSFSSQKSKNFTFTLNGTQQTKEISYYPVSVSLEAQSSGVTQSLQIAKVTDPYNNEFRNVILQYDVPMSLNLGTLTYTLTSADFMQ